MTNHYNHLASYFAAIAATQGPLAIRGDVLRSVPDDSEGLPHDSIQSIGSEPDHIAAADPVPHPAESYNLHRQQAVFASLATLGITVFSFSFAPLGTDDGADDPSEVAASYCSAHRLELLGACFSRDRNEITAIVRGTRSRTEAGIVALWRETEAPTEDADAWRQEHLTEAD